MILEKTYVAIVSISHTDHHSKAMGYPCPFPGGGGGGTRQKRVVRTKNLKIHPPTHIFSDIDPYLQIFDENFSTFIRVFDHFLMIVFNSKRYSVSNYEILDNNLRF